MVSSNSVRNWVALRLTCYLAFTITQLARFSAATASASTQHAYQANANDAVPSFIIIGTAKGGTTDLYAQLVDDAVNKDPLRREPPITRSHQKELDFLTSLKPEDFNQLAPGGPLYMEYLRHLGHACANVTKDALSSCLRDKGLQTFTMDATPTYLFSAVAPRALAIISPRSKAIAMLRDPVGRAQVLFRHVIVDVGMWADRSIDQLADSFFKYIQEHANVQEVLSKLKACVDAACLAQGWQDVWASGLMDTEENRLFAGGLYRYALAAWRVHYLQPGRFMLIESDLYFGKRTYVIDQVTRFLYGREATATESSNAGGLSFWRKDVSAVSSVGRKWVLSAPQRARVRQFYAEHVVAGFSSLVEDMRKGGAWVLGFEEGDPWTQPTGAI